MEIFIQFIQIWFTSIWDMFSIKWPGFDFSIAMPFLAVAFAVVALKIVFIMTGISFSSIPQTVSSAYRSRNSSSHHVSSDKKG